MKNVITLFFLFGAFALLAQNDYSTSILASAEKNAQAFKEKNYSNLVEYMHPNIISMGGGKDLMASVVESQLNAFAEQNIEVTNITFGSPADIVKAGEELHCIVSQNTEMSMNGQTFSQDTNLLAASLDNGETWKFIDLAQYDKESLKIFIPNFNDSLVIPQN